MENKKYLSQEKQSFCLVQALINGTWVPMGVASSRETDNDFESASALSDELRENGRITCIVPTENWSFVTVDTAAYAIKITPFTKGLKDVEFIEHRYRELQQSSESIDA